MHVVNKTSEYVIISVTEQDLAGVSKILHWVEDSRNDMDEGRVLLEEDEIDTVINGWTSLIDQAFEQAEADA